MDLPGGEPGPGPGGAGGPAAELAADSRPPASAEYTSGSFAEFIASTEEADIPVISPGSIPRAPAAPAGGGPLATGFDALLSAPLATAPGGTAAPAGHAARAAPGGTAGTAGHAARAGRTTYPAEPAAVPAADEDGGRNGPSAAVGPTVPSGLLAGPGYVRPSRARVLAAIAVVAILGIAGVTGTLIVMHRHPAAAPAASGATPSRAARSHSRSPSASRGTSAEGRARWTAAVPVDPQTLPAAGAHVTALSCLHPTVCYAADSVGGVLGLQSAGNWPVAVTDPSGGLVALSCAAPAFCAAIDSAGNALTLSQGSWSSPAVIGSGSGTVTSVSCTGPAFCMAVDSVGQAFTYRGAGVGWSQQAVDPSGQALDAVSCAGPTDCVAVGATGAEFRYDGTTWSAPDMVDSGHQLVAVSCPDTTFCMAVDSSGLAAQYSAGQWTLSPLGWTPTVVSCPAAGSCLAAGASGVVASYSGGRWSKPSAVDNGTPISQLSCVAMNSCTAIDTSDDALFYSPATG